MTLSIEKFSPKKSELIKLANEYKTIKIDGLDDSVGYKKADEARKDLKSKRVEIQKVGKVLRADALKFQKEVIAYEKYLIGVIEPIEKGLKEQQDEIKKQKERIARKELLPERIKMLSDINVDIEEEILLDMDDIEFQAFYNSKHDDYLEEKNKVLKAEKEAFEEQKRLEEMKKRAEKEAFEEQKRLEEMKKRAEKEARERLLFEAEEEKRKKEQERKRLEQKQKEDEESLRRSTEYKNWLKKNDVDNPEGEEVYIKRDGNTYILYKKVDFIVIK